LNAKVFTPGAAKAKGAQKLIDECGSRERAASIYEDYKASRPKERDAGPRWRKPMSEREAEEMRADAAAELAKSKSVPATKIELSPSLRAQLGLPPSDYDRRMSEIDAWLSERGEIYR
jgi:hypothetical protein